MAAGVPVILSTTHYRLSTIEDKTFVAAGFLDESDASPLEAWEDGVYIVHASMLLHCFELPTQVRACKRIVALLKAWPGSMLVGRSGGVSVAVGGPREEEVKGLLGRIGGMKGTRYLHNVESFKEMWELVEGGWD
ncbi:hypothetical protein Daus18300_013636 [Diaporthe australafricana]|uniref:Methyltransferase type 11 domain-containing protein n=1 Tax=Diaporthe australafricana TaxID=127596 RepID=A0ABR3VYC9_9PEZI